MFQSGLQIIEAALGPDHANLAAELGNLAATYASLGRPADALPLEEWALAITQTASSLDRQDVANVLGNLAVTLGDLDRAADTLPLEERALAITETALGPGHPTSPTAWRTRSPPTEPRPGCVRIAARERALAITEAAEDRGQGGRESGWIDRAARRFGAEDGDVYFCPLQLSLTDVSFTCWAPTLSSLTHVDAEDQVTQAASGLDARIKDVAAHSANFGFLLPTFPSWFFMAL